MMTSTDELNAHAQAFADELAAADTMYHSSELGTLGEGENLFMASGHSTPDYVMATQMWYDELTTPGYDFNDMDTWQAGAGHFTQVVWNASTELGMGHAFSASGKLFIVARYKSRGNFMGQFQSNVFQLTGATAESCAVTATDDGTTDDNTTGGDTTDNDTTDGNTNGDDTTQSEFTADQEAGLSNHNLVRCYHGAQAMTLSADLNAHAQSFADELAAADTMYHSSELNALGEGENLFMSSAANVNYEEATTLWYNELHDPGYDFDNMDTWQSGAGHFTQVVWNASTELGMGHAVSASGKLYVVARYKSRGNYLGQFPANVFPLKYIDYEPSCDNYSADTSTDEAATTPEPEPTPPSSDPFLDHEDMFSIENNNRIDNCNAYQAIDLPDDLTARPIDNQGRNAYNAWINIDQSTAVSWTHPAGKCQATILDGRNVLTSAECCTPQMILDCTPHCDGTACTDPCASDRGQMKIQITVGVESDGTTNPTLTGGCPYSSSTGDIYLNPSNHAIRNDFCIIHIDEEETRDTTSRGATGSIFDIFEYSSGEHTNCFDRKAMPCIGTDLNNPNYDQSSYNDYEPSADAYDVLQYKSHQFNHYESSDSVGPQVGQECWVYNGSTQQPMKLEIVDLALCETENQHPGGELYHNDGVTFCAGVLVDADYGYNCDFPYDDGTRGGSIICNVDNKATMMGVLVDHQITTDCSQVGLLAEFRSFSVSDTHWMKTVLEFFNNQYTVPNAEYVNAITTIIDTASSGAQISNVYIGNSFLTPEQFVGYQNQASDSMPQSELEDFDQPMYNDRPQYEDYYVESYWGGDPNYDFGLEVSHFTRTRTDNWTGPICNPNSSADSSRKKRSNIGGYGYKYNTNGMGQVRPGPYRHQKYLVNIGFTSTPSTDLPAGWGDPTTSNDQTLQVTTIERACMGVVISDTEIMTTADCCEGMESVAIRFGKGDYIGLDYDEKTMDMGYVPNSMINDGDYTTNNINTKRRKIFNDGTNIIINPLFKPPGRQDNKELFHK